MDQNVHPVRPERFPGGLVQTAHMERNSGLEIQFTLSANAFLLQFVSWDYPIGCPGVNRKRSLIKTSR